MKTHALEPMTISEFDQFRELSLAEYASERSRESGESLEKCFQRAENEFQRLLPMRKETANHFFYSVKELESDLYQGYLWFGIEEVFGQKKIFIFDIMILKPYQNLGIGKFALDWLSAHVEELGFSEIRLHVLAHNQRARALYKKAGFRETSIYMSKRIDGSKD